MISTVDVSFNSFTDANKELEKQFYSKKFYFSYSSMNKLLWNPSQFYTEYILKKREVRNDKHLLEGKCIHALLLSHKIFDKLFVIMPGKLPGDNIRKIVDNVFKLYKAETELNRTGKTLTSYKTEILQQLVNINLYQKYVDDKKPVNGVSKTGDEKRLDQILVADAITYFDFLKKKGPKDVIDQDTYDFCNEAANRVRSNKTILRLMGLDDDLTSTKLVLNEVEFYCDLDKHPVGLKGIIDNHVVDYDDKVILINDVKTSGKGLKDFDESIEYYNYWMQAVVYVLLICSHYREYIDNGFRIEFRFIVIDRYQNIYPFKVTNKTLKSWIRRFETESLHKALYHYTNKQYTLPYEFANELIVL